MFAVDNIDGSLEAEVVVAASLTSSSFPRDTNRSIQRTRNWKTCTERWDVACDRTSVLATGLSQKTTHLRSALDGSATTSLRSNSVKAARACGEIGAQLSLQSVHEFGRSHDCNPLSHHSYLTRCQLFPAEPVRIPRRTWKNRHADFRARLHQRRLGSFGLADRGRK